MSFLVFRFSALARHHKIITTIAVMSESDDYSTNVYVLKPPGESHRLRQTYQVSALSFQAHEG
jgi:hypothetical protein